MKIATKQREAERRRAGRAVVAAATREHVENLERRVLLSTVTLHSATTYQTIKGFGGDYAEGYFDTFATDPVGTYNMQNLSPKQVRVPILLQDWAPTQSGSYSDTGEITQEFQLMQQAQSAGAQIVASVWTVPNWMVNNPTASDDRIITPGLYGQVATDIAAWLQQAKSAYGVNVSDVSFNEPDGGFTVSFTSATLDQFIKTSGALFQTDGLSTKWAVGDTSQIDGSAQYIAPILADSAALPYINAIAVHAWNSEYAPLSEFQSIAQLGQEYNLPVWSTETNFGPTNLGNFNSWSSASQVAQTYLDVLGNAQASVVDYWEYQDDQPLLGPFNTPYPTFYVVQQFEQYLPVGSQIVQSTSDDGNLQVVAGQFNGNFTVEALNANSADTPTTITGLPDGTYSLITTDAAENAAVSAPIVVSGGTATVTLPAGSFDTFTALAPLLATQPPTGTGTGLNAVYFQNANANGFFTALVNPAYSEVDPTVNFNWGEVAPASVLSNGNFSVQWTGSVEAQYTETYTFSTESDGGVQLFVNGQGIINDFSQHTSTIDTGTISLVAGQLYSIKINYYQKNDYALMALGWQSASTPLETIPSTLLYPTTSTGSGTGLLGEYSVNTGSNPPAAFGATPTLVRIDPVVDFNWTNSSPDPSLPGTNYQVEWTGTIVPQYSETYTFTTTSDDGARLFVNGQPLVNDWNVQQSTANSGAITLVAGQPYSIDLQYFQGTGSSSVDLQWQSPSTPLQDVPTSQLYPAATTPPTPPSVSISAISPAASTNLVSGSVTDAIFQFTRSDVNLSSPLSVDYTLTGTAVSGVDYQSVTGIVTFATGYTTATVNIIPKGDSAPGSALTAIATIAPGSAYSIGAASATATIDDPPVAPTTLTAVAGAGQVSLTWPAVAGATRYNIYRSAAPGGEGLTAYLSGLAGTSYVDPGVSGGTTYYYKVTAVLGAAEGNPSIEASANPTGGASGASSLTDADIGFPTLAGSGSSTKGVYTLSGSGSDIWNAYDQFNFDSTTIAGNAAMVVRVDSETFVDPWTKAGLMFRDSNSPNAANFAVFSTPNNGVSAQWRNADGGSSSYANTLAGMQVVPTWLEITRSGNVFTAYYSIQTVSSPAQVVWTQLGSAQTIAMGSALAGIAVTSHNNASIATATFDNFSITGSGVAPAAPSSFTAAAGVGAIALSWPAVNGATYYDVYRGTTSTGEGPTPLYTNISAITYSDTNVTPGTAYYYTVEAVDDVGNSPPSPEATATAFSAGAPATLSATPAANAISLQWAAVPNAIGYSIYRGPATGAESTTPIISGYGLTSYSDTGVTVGTPYYYFVTATVGAGTTPASPEATAAAFAAGPATLTARPDVNAVDLSWAAVPNATGYSVFRGATAGGESAPALITGLTGTTYPDSTATPATTYYYIVIATVASVSSSASPEAAAAATPAAPATLTATGGAANVVLAWAPVTGATSYNIYRSGTPGGEGTLATYPSVSTTGYTDTAVTAAMPYYYTVTAVENGVQGPQSTEATATTAAVAGPATLIAMPGVDAITLSWATVPSATGYSVYRGTTPGGESSIALVSGWSSTTYPDSTTTPGTTYYYIVTATVASVSTAASPEAAAAAIPAAPATLTATGGIAQTVLSWAPVAGATSYNVYRSATPGGEGSLATYSDVTASNYTDTSLDSGTPYYYTVTAVETGVESPQSPEATATAIATTGPTTLTATATVGGIKLSWSAVDGAISYSIYSGTAPGQESGTPLVTGYTGTTYPDTAATPPGTDYYYFVTASMTTGPSTPSPEAHAAALPGTPAALTATGSAGQVVLSWATVAGATSYDIYRSTTPGGEGTLATYSGISGTSYTDTAVTVSTAYYYTVTAVEGVAQSPTSAEATAAATSVAGPATLTAAPGTGSITLSWATVPGATGYSIYRGTTPGGESGIALISGRSSTTYPDSSVTPGTTYYYTVIAAVASGPTTASPEAFAVAIPAAPATLTAAGSAGQVVLTWASVPGATSYDIYKTTIAGAEGTVATYTGVSATGYTDSAVTAGTVTYYTVTAVENGVQSNQSTQASAAATAVAGPATLTATPGTGSIALSWSAVAGASSYNLYRGTTPGGEIGTPWVASWSSTSYPDTTATPGTAYYYYVTASVASGSTSNSPEASAAALPPAPAALTATAGIAQIVLSWAAVPGATGYDIYKTSTSGAEGTIATFTGLSTTSYTDATVSTTAPTYYTVTAVENGVQSVQSTQASAIASAPVGSALTDINIGSPAITGTTSFTNNVYTVSGGGGDIFGTSDQFNFAYQAVTATNVSLVTQVTAQTATDPWAKAGLMFRDAVAAGGAEFSVYATPSNGLLLQWRSSDGALTSYTTALSGKVVPTWLEIIRTGNVYTAYYSTQSTGSVANVTWNLIGAPQTINMTSTYAGLAVTAHNNASLSTATFANYALSTAATTTSTTTTFTDLDIGTPTPAGSASVNTGIYTVSGSGADFFGTSDQGNFDYTTVTGNTTAVVQVNSQTNTNSWAKAGLMFRDSVAAGGANFALFATPGNGVELQWRTADGGATSYATALSGNVVPAWLEIVRVGNVFTAYYSTQSTTVQANVTWTVLGSPVTIAMPTTALAGLAVTSHNAGTLSTATFGNLSINGAGTVAPPATPTTLSATSGIGQITLSWSAVTGATSYDVYRSTTSGAEGTLATYTGITGTTYTDTAVTASTPYYYTVTAVANGVQSSQSTQATAAATAPAPPSTPATLAATTGIGQITLSWSSVPSATSYDVYRSTISGAEGTLATYTGVTGITYTDTAVTVSTPYFYTVTAVQAGVQSNQSTQATATATAPASPATLTATGGSGQIVLSWASVPGATSYDIYKTTTSGAEGSLATYTGITGAIYADTAVTATTPYYYTVTAAENSAQSAQSTQATATASAPVGSALTDINIGTPAITGTTSFAGNVYTVSGGGADIFGTADQFNFAYQTVTATNVTLVTQVTSQTASDPWAKAGLMFRDAVAAGGADFAVYATPGNGLLLQWRLSDGGTTSYTSALAGNTLPVWLEIVRVGNVFTAYYSTQSTAVQANVTWTALGSSESIPMSTAYAGLAVTAHNNASLSTATFANYALSTATTTTVTNPTLTDLDMGSPSPVGSASSTNATYTVSGSGADFFGTSDQGNFDYTTVTGNTTAVVQVNSQTNTNSWAKAGLMFRDSVAAGGANFALFATPGNGVELQWRTADGGATSYATALSGNVVPAWLEIVRVGNVFTAYYSTQSTTVQANVTWTVLGSPVTIAMPTTALAGLAVTSHNAGTLSTATFSNLSL